MNQERGLRANGALQDDYLIYEEESLLDFIFEWLIFLQSNPLRSLRHTGTLAIHHLVTSVIKIANKERDCVDEVRAHLRSFFHMCASL